MNRDWVAERGGKFWELVLHELSRIKIVYTFVFKGKNIGFRIPLLTLISLTDHYEN